MLLVTVALVFLASRALAWMEVPQDPKASPQQPIKDVYFGDMVMPKNQAKAAFSGIQDKAKLWTNAVIPYTIDCSIENRPISVWAVKAAMAEWESKTCIRFVEKTTEKIGLTFFRDSHCWGNVGMVEWSHISVGEGCDFRHVMTHEIGHVVGFYHEQNRLDRDDWVDVHWDNIGKFDDAFRKVQGTGDYGVPYDYESIMHYPWNAFSSNGKDTMSPKKALNGKVPYVELSKDDALQVSRMYNCPEIEKKRMRSRTKYVKGMYANAASFSACEDKHSSCPGWAKAGYCSQNDFVMENCKKSCKSPSCSGDGGQEEKIECKDKDRSCRDWAQVLNDCDLSSVRKLCPVSCDVNNCAKKVCLDTRKDCPSWANDLKHCHLESVKKACPKSCGQCTKGTDAPATKKPVTNAPVTNPPVTNPPKTDSPITAPNTGATVTKPPVTAGPTAKPPKKQRNYLGSGVFCFDEYAKCKEWQEQGECKNNPIWMHVHCMKACKQEYPDDVRCDLKPPRPPGQCSNPLGLGVDEHQRFTLPDSAFSSPDHFKPGQSWEAAPGNARLYYVDDWDRKRIGAWCANGESQTKDPSRNYIQVDLGSSKTINYIATQGRDRYFEAVQRYKVKFSNDGRTFEDYKENGTAKEFVGSCDNFTPVLNKFEGMQARFLRLYPTDWNFPCLRMELYGC